MGEVVVGVYGGVDCELWCVCECDVDLVVFWCEEGDEVVVVYGWCGVMECGYDEVGCCFLYLVEVVFCMRCCVEIYVVEGGFFEEFGGGDDV